MHSAQEQQEKKDLKKCLRTSRLTCLIQRSKNLSYTNCKGKQNRKMKTFWTKVQRWKKDTIRWRTMKVMSISTMKLKIQLILEWILPRLANWTMLNCSWSNRTWMILKTMSLSTTKNRLYSESRNNEAEELRLLLIFF